MHFFFHNPLCFYIQTFLFREYLIFREISIHIQEPWNIRGSARETLRFEFDGDIRMIGQEKWGKLFTLGKFDKMMCPNGAIFVEEERDV